MKKLLLAALLALLPCCAVNAQSGVPGQGMGVPSTAPFVGFSLLAKSGTAASVTGTATETILATVAIPPNTIGANGQIRINTYWTTPNNADNKILKLRLGTTGVSSTQIYSNTITTFANPWIVSLIQNLNATNSQNTNSEGTRGTDGLVLTTALAASAIDMTQSQNIYITGTLGTTTDTITLTGYSVEAVF